MNARIYLRCSKCGQPKQFGFQSYQRARHAFPDVDPSRGFIRDEDPRGAGLPPFGHRDWCSCRVSE